MLNSKRFFHFALLQNRVYYSSNTNLIYLSDFIYKPLWWHMKNFPGMRASFELNTKKKIYSTLGQSLKQRIDILRKDKDIRTQDLFKAMQGIFEYLLFYELRKLKKNIHTFSSRLSKPLYTNIDKIKVDSNLKIDAIPFMDIANPLMYFYSKYHSKKNLMLVFMTQSNNLNMPFLLANELLKKYDMHICYIYNRREDQSSEIRKLINIFYENDMVNDMFAIAVSSGLNHLIERYTELPIKRIINYSGGTSKKTNTLKRELFFENLSKYSKKQNCEIMSILSSHNAFDQNLYMNYSLFDVKTQYQFIDSESHGTFTLSFQKDLLDDHFSWLTSKS